MIKLIFVVGICFWAGVSGEGVDASEVEELEKSLDQTDESVKELLEKTELIWDMAVAENLEQAADISPTALECVKNAIAIAEAQLKIPLEDQVTKAEQEIQEIKEELEEAETEGDIEEVAAEVNGIEEKLVAEFQSMVQNLKPSIVLLREKIAACKAQESTTQ